MTGAHHNGALPCTCCCAAKRKHGAWSCAKSLDADPARIAQHTADQAGDGLRPRLGQRHVIREGESRYLVAVRVAFDRHLAGFALNCAADPFEQLGASRFKLVRRRLEQLANGGANPNRRTVFLDRDQLLSDLGFEELTQAAELHAFGCDRWR